MTLLPIVERELRVASRRAGTFWGRVLVALAALLVFGGVMAVLVGNTTPSSSHGRYLFGALLIIAFGYCLLAGARATADCLSEEKREGTLGLLFLTDLKGYDVVLGKLAATSVNTIYGLIAIVPVLAVSLQLGGITAGELIRAALMLLNTLLFSLTAGLFVSAMSQDERKAMFSTLFVVIGSVLGPLMVSFSLGVFLGLPEEGAVAILALSPAFDLGYLLYGQLPRGFPGLWLFWGSFVWIHLLNWALLVATCWLLPRVWQARERKSAVARVEERFEQKLYGNGLTRRRFRRRLLDQNPFLWLAQRERGKPWYVWFYVVAVTTTWLWGRVTQGSVMFDANVFMPGLMIIQAFFKVWIVSEACTRLAHDRRSGALELLLSTPLTPADVLRGQWLALRRQFLKPLLVLAVLECLVLWRADYPELTWMNALMFLADFMALGWVGMWLGLSAKNLVRALAGTVGLVLVLPWLATFTAWILLRSFTGTFNVPDDGSIRFVQTVIWFGVGISNSAVWGGLWARHRLRHRFLATTLQL